MKRRLLFIVAAVYFVAVMAINIAGSMVGYFAEVATEAVLMVILFGVASWVLGFRSEPKPKMVRPPIFQWREITRTTTREEKVPVKPTETNQPAGRRNT